MNKNMVGERDVFSMGMDEERKKQMNDSRIWFKTRTKPKL